LENQTTQGSKKRLKEQKIAIILDFTKLHILIICATLTTPLAMRVVLVGIGEKVG
jgi:hypothetical protein